MIGIIDYGAGNRRSVINALERLGAAAFVSGSVAALARADRLILPGVGAAGSAMKLLEERGLAGWLRTTELPLLGICLGAQLLFERSAESDRPCLGLLPGSVERFDLPDLKAPHMGWNRVHRVAPDPLFDGIDDGEFFYFVHSYYMAPGVATIGRARHGVEIAAAVSRGNARGVQFHPEKSGAAGLRLLNNFIALC